MGRINGGLHICRRCNLILCSGGLRRPSYQRGRREARPVLLPLLRRRPTPELIEAMAEIADAETLVLLGRIAREQPALAATAKTALEAADDPQAEKILATIARDAR